MMPDQPWTKNGARAASRAWWPGRFIDQHISPLFFSRTERSTTVHDSGPIISEQQFWSEGQKLILGTVRLRGFRLTDWFPRTPGVYWSIPAHEARHQVTLGEPLSDSELGKYFSPEGKANLIEEGGIGTIRLRPRRIDDEDCWFATALSGNVCHCGIPVAVPNTLLRQARIDWGDQVDIVGRVRFLQDAGLDVAAAGIHHTRPLIVFVDELKGMKTRPSVAPIVICPVALFETTRSEYSSDRAQYTFVSCAAGLDSELDNAADWIQKYATKYRGRVITNFDEQRPVLAEAPLSYQRLVAKAYDRTVIERFAGTINVDRIDRLVQESVTTMHFGDTVMGHKITVGGSAIINIDSVLNSVSQTIGASDLASKQKTELDELVQSLRANLQKVNATHPDETKEIAAALEKAVANAAKPLQERKQNLLQLSAKGLRDAAELVKDIAPEILTTAGLIAKFIVGL
jgi:hypothetical protein